MKIQLEKGFYSVYYVITGGRFMYCHVIQFILCILCCLLMTSCLRTCSLPEEKPPPETYVEPTMKLLHPNSAADSKDTNKNGEKENVTPDKQDQENTGTSDKQEQEKSQENNKSEK